MEDKPTEEGPVEKGPHVVMERDTCPVCGSTEWIVRNKVRAAIAAGTIDKSTQPCLSPLATVISTPNKLLIAPRVAEQITALTDVCECGAIFAWKVISTPSVVGNMPAGNQMPSGLGQPHFG